MTRRITQNHNHDGINRRGFLECMAWVGTGVLYTVAGGVLRSETIGRTLADAGSLNRGAEHGFTFAQISDSHIGFNRETNYDVTATLQEAVARINALPNQPDFIIHTGDISHLSAPGEFDTVDQVLKSLKANQVFFVPGEHDVLADEGKTYLDRYGKGAKGDGWYSFDHKGVHFIGLVNVVKLKPGGMGLLGSDQLGWFENDVSGLSSSTPVVVFAHIPLWSIYPDWGWGTDDSAQVLGYLKRFGSVTVLNGHIHQTMQKVEGNVSFHTAMSTAFPQPRPGMGSGPGPLKGVPAAQLRSLLGITDVRYIVGQESLAVIDSTLACTPDANPAKKEFRQ